MRTGIRLSEYEHVLGENADQLKRLFPDGVARLWGATPAQKERNAKAVAIRERRVGDEVLFYGEMKFIARARILGLLHNPGLAAEVWGFDENHRTWEHIMALGDVIEFEVPAAPVLTALDMKPPLWSLTLVPAAKRKLHLHLLDELLGGQASTVRRPVLGKGIAAPVESLGRGDLQRALGTLDADTSAGPRARSESLTLLWAIGRLVTGHDRMAPLDVWQSQLGPILSEFGPPGVAVSPEYPFRHLSDSGLWEVESAEHRDPDLVSVAASIESGGRAGFRRAAARLLRQPLARAEAIGLLCASYLDDVDQPELLERVGLGGYAYAGGSDGGQDDSGGGGRSGRRGQRRQVTVSRPDRDKRLVERVKLLHGHRCQVCGLRLETRFSHYSEAAHIQGLGHPHNGPDKTSNLLCLCPNHHVQFDTLALFIDEDWIVRRSQDGSRIGVLRRHPEHHIDERYVEYHRGLCGGNRLGSTHDRAL
ncbi:HNH endonuclease [Streptomyces ossamyceticus]|uniref:HNH endonuclease n=1 Tax=Streptomyces ossamyceticus TaxID=249581 RepID=UPI001F0A34CF|nr:HNH endonuclease [Streptomyces ossamyceticus]